MPIARWWGICDYSRVIRMVAGYLPHDDRPRADVHAPETCRDLAYRMLIDALGKRRWHYDWKPARWLPMYDLTVRQLRTAARKEILPFYLAHPGEFFPRAQLDDLVPVCL